MSLTYNCSNLFEPQHSPILLIMNLKSRFVSQKIYRVYVLFDKNKVGIESILHYCCDCKVGKRTIGCCSHTMTMLYYLGIISKTGQHVEVAGHLKHYFDNNNYAFDEMYSDEDE